jgi:signal peptidase I
MTTASASRSAFWRELGGLSLGLLALLLLAVLLLGCRSMLFQSFSVPSGSMKPTLLIGDYFVASKYPYGYSRYSFPGSPPLFAGRILAAPPRYGDVVVFRLPRDPSTVYVKRVVGLPGDRIQMIHGLLHINGTPVKRERIADFADPDASGRTAHGKQWRETLPNGVTHATLDLMDEGYYDNTPVYPVPPGHYFMMGDNRDNAVDSRLSQVGYIPFEYLVGRVDRIIFSTDRFERIGTAVQ